MSKAYFGFTLPLTPVWTVRMSLIVGPPGPLLRFDQSISPSSSSARTEVRQRRSMLANGGSPRAPEGQDGSARPGRFFRWSRE